tara:strand:+ start:646 stop:1104 length:459 start_codon:yes stop_codon:yes gene_type:complete
MKKIAVFPGSFSPFTIGHQAIVEKAFPIFEKIIIAIGNNKEKKQKFSIKKRKKWIKSVYLNNEKIEVEEYNGLTVDFCEQNNANYIIRGIRNSEDFRFEKNIALMNKDLNKEIETIFFSSDKQLTHISSTIVRDILRNGGDISNFIPKEMKL